MSAEGVKKFIAAVDLIYPAPQYDGNKVRQGAWLALMTQTLGACSDEVLSAAASDILRTREGKFFPTLKECVEATQQAAERLERSRTPLLAGPKEVPYEARVALARDLMKSPMGQLARRENWDVGMYEFCLEHMRVPAGADIEACKRAAKEFRAGYERLLQDGHPFKGGLAKLADNIVAKAREIMGDAR